MKTQAAVLAMAFATISIGCSSGDSEKPPGTGGSQQTGGATSSGGTSSSGGSVSSGGSSSTGGSQTGGSGGSGGSKATGGSAGGAGGGAGGSGGGGTCTSVTPCGGDVVGTWTVSSSCLKVSGEVDMDALGLECKRAPVTGSLSVTGKWTAKADGTYTDETVTTGNVELSLPASCLNISGTVTTCDRLAQVVPSLGFASATCKNAATGGGCTCPATINQSGWAGIVSTNAMTSGNYKVASNVLTIDSEVGYSYCVASNKMTWTPKGADGTPTVWTGTIVLQNGSTPGTGGAGGGAGGARTGGTTGSGGTAGGAGGAGGARTGGTTGSGGGTTTGGTAAGGTTGTGGTTSGNRGDGPCDIYAAAATPTPCVAAYSMVRALSKTYNGPLYQVRKNSSATNTGTGGSTTDIGMLPDGYADIATQDAFCSGTTCTVSLLYDQSGNENNIGTGKKGNYGCDTGDTACQDDYESSATKLSITAGGHKVYALYMNAHEGYRSPLGVKQKNVPLGNAAEGIYELADGTHSGTACCWDFGNVSTDPKVYGVMNTLFFGTAYWGKGEGSGPWFMADFEAGVWAGGSKQGDPGWGSLEGAASSPANTKNPSLKVPFAFGILKTTTSNYALRMANLQTATDLTTAFDGALPKAMNNLGGVVLGVGGDNSNHSFGTFFEGAITKGSPSNDTDLAVFKNVKAVGYTK